MLSITFAQAYLNQSQRKMCPTLQSYWFSSFLEALHIKSPTQATRGKLCPDNSRECAACSRRMAHFSRLIQQRGFPG